MLWSLDSLESLFGSQAICALESLIEMHQTCSIANGVPQRASVERNANVGDRKSLSIAMNHPKTSLEFSEQFGPSTHIIMGLGKNSRQKDHPNFAKNLGRQILGNTISGPQNGGILGRVLTRVESPLNLISQ